MLKIVEDALLSDKARDAEMNGWSLDDIRRSVCVECGSINLPDFGPSGAAVPEKMPGRKIGYGKNGTRYDAGCLCGDCMTARTKTEHTS